MLESNNVKKHILDERTARALHSLVTDTQLTDESQPVRSMMDEMREDLKQESKDMDLIATRDQEYQM